MPLRVRFSKNYPKRKCVLLEFEREGKRLRWQKVSYRFAFCQRKYRYFSSFQLLFNWAIQRNLLCSPKPNCIMKRWTRSSFVAVWMMNERGLFIQGSVRCHSLNDLHWLVNRFLNCFLNSHAHHSTSELNPHLSRVGLIQFDWISPSQIVTHKVLIFEFFFSIFQKVSSPTGMPVWARYYCRRSGSMQKL